MRVAKDGLGYRAAILEEGVALSVDRITDTRGETYGELTVERSPEGHLMRSRVALSSSNSRGAAAGYLTRRVRGVDWIAHLEAFCLEVLRQEREGAPAVAIGRLPPRSGVEFVLEPLLPVNKPTILFGEEGTGKSTLAAAIAVAVATGVPTFSRWRVPRPRGVLVLDWEADEADWNDLIVAVARGNGLDPPENVWYLGCSRSLTDEINRIARLIDQNDVGLLIVDSVGLASPSTRDGADAAEGALRLFGALRVLGTTSLLVDHVNKTVAETGHGSRPYGSVYKPALARATYELRAAEQADHDGARHMALFHRKGNTTRIQPPVGIKISRSPTECLLTWEPVMLSDDRIAKGATLTDRIRDLLKDGPLTADDVANATESSPEVIRRTLNRHKGLFVAVTKPGEKANLWALVSNRDTVPGHVPPGVRDSGTTPLRGVVSHVSHQHPGPSKEGSFDALSRLNEGRSG